MVERDLLEQWLHNQLQIDRFKDYAPNGLQVEGGVTIKRMVTGVTANLALIQKAIDEKADTILVHHGLFWKGQSPCVKGWMKARLQLLLGHQINLFAYHLPLDAHPHWGNNAQLAKVLGLRSFDVQRVGEQDLVWLGQPEQESIRLDDFQHQTESRLNKNCLLIGDPQKTVSRVAWCSGGAQGYFQAAIEAQVDLFITGEISEPQVHAARESGVAFLACGHHATERYGVMALGEAIAQEWGIETLFIEVDNPV